MWLSTKNITPSNLPANIANSLKARKIGPYKIIQVITPTAYRLELPSSMRCHNVFHISQLSQYFDPVSEFSSREVPQNPPLMEVQGNPEWEVEKILDMKDFRGKPKYLVKWKGYSDYDSTWEPLENLENSKELVNEYHAKLEEDLKRRRQARNSAEDVRVPRGGISVKNDDFLYY